MPTRSQILDHEGLLGSYAWAYTSAVIPTTVGPTEELFQWRWSNTTKTCVIRKLAVSAAVSTTMFAAGPPLIMQLTRASAWTAQGTAGTGVTFGAENKKSSAFPSTAMANGDCRIIAADLNGLGAGTKTLETYSLSILTAQLPITGSLQPLMIPPLTTVIDASNYPIILRPQATAFEGIVLICGSTQTTGTWKLSLAIEWDEYQAA